MVPGLGAGTGSVLQLATIPTQSPFSLLVLNEAMFEGSVHGDP